MLFLQIAVTVLFLAQKIGVLFGNIRVRKLAWQCGAIAAVLAIIYFFKLGLRVFTATEVGLIVLMGHASLDEKGKHKWLEIWVRVITGGVMAVITLFAGLKWLPVSEFIAGVLMLVATFCIARKYHVS